MAISQHTDEPLDSSDGESRPAPGRAGELQLARWGGVAGLAGVALLLGSVIVVVALGLPDASDPETLTDFADIESGRVAEHLLYLGAVMAFALHAFVLQRLLEPTHRPAALFATVTSAFGLVAMAASAVLHASTAPLAALYTTADNTPEDLRAIEYAWHGAQSVFDTMLTTGLLLVPLGILFYGVAMRRAPGFGPRVATTALVLGSIGLAGAVAETIDTGSDLSAASVLALVVFNAVAGWRTLRWSKEAAVADRPARRSRPGTG